MLFSGMGGDGALFQALRIPEVDLLTPAHTDPKPGENLVEYAARLAQLFEIGKDDVVGGSSFGGMIAAEIARQRPVSGLVLLGSCLRPSRLPKPYRLLERFGGLIPDFLLNFRGSRLLLRWRFAPLTAEAERALAKMAQVYDTAQLRAFGRMLFGWSGVEAASCPVLSIHGDRDRIIPLAAAEPGVVLKDAGHAFTLTHAEETVAEIRAFLRGSVLARQP